MPGCKRLVCLDGDQYQSIQQIPGQRNDPVIASGSSEEIRPSKVGSAENGGVPTRRVPSRIAVLDMGASRFEHRAPKNHKGRDRFSIQLYPIAFPRDEAGDAIANLEGSAAKQPRWSAGA